MCDKCPLASSIKYGKCYYFHVRLVLLHFLWNHTHAKDILSTNQFTGCHQHGHNCLSQTFVDVGNYLLLPHLSFCTGNHLNQYNASHDRSYMFFFLDSYVPCVLLKYLHSNHNTTSALPKICFSVQPPYH